MPTFDTPEPISVTVDIGVGDTRIIAADRSDTIVDIRPSNGSKKADIEAAEQTRVEYADGRLLVKTPKNWKQYTPFGGHGSIDVAIKLPTGSRFHGDSTMGTFDSEGRLGECRIKTAMGDIRLERTGTLQAKTDYGDVTVDRAEGHVDVTTGSGEVRIREIDGTAAIKNSNGDTRVETVAGDLRVKAANGDVSVGQTSASVVAKTANGNVRLGDVIQGSIVLETACGELEVGIREGSAAWLDASSQYGSVHNSLEASSGPEHSDKTVQLRARTAYGDIVIRRSHDVGKPQ